MTPYQKLFTINCLQRIENILSDNAAMEEAIRNFTKDDHKNQRFQSSQITDGLSWEETDRVRITSAIFEAVFQATQEICIDEEHTRPISTATEFFLKTIVPKITAHTKPENRLNSVKEHCTKMSATLNNDSTQENSYSFFQIAGTAVVVTAAFVLALK